MELAIYGAKSIALGAFYAIREIYPKQKICCFLVSRRENNASKLAGVPVFEIKDFSDRYKNKKECCILIATPEDLHQEIIDTIHKYDFTEYVCLDSKREECLMEAYYKSKFISIKDKPQILEVYQATYIGDRALKHIYNLPTWIKPLQIGAALTDRHFVDLIDSIGDNISHKRGNYNELVGLYWIWKNKIYLNNSIEYYGLFQYRRILNVLDEDIYFLKANNVDVVLPFPTIHEPDIKEHHQRYIKEADWEAMLIALGELHPEYAKGYETIFSQQYFYNYNLIIAKKKVLEEYCEWLFPILERTEELVTPKGCEREDRFIGYLGENLMTLYFMYHKDDLKIYHTGRLMFT